MPLHFQNPNILWGLISLIIPIIIHLFNFKRFKPIYFSSRKFLKSVTAENKNKSKIKNWLLLLTRLLALACIIIAFSQPFLPNRNTSLIDKNKNNTAHIYVDNSFSMNAETEKGIAIEIAKACEDSALAFDKRITNSDGASLDTFEGFKVYGNTHGQLVGYPSSRHSLSCVVIAGEGDDMQRDYAYTVSRKFDLLDAPAIVGAEAARETLSRLNPQKLPTGKVPVMFKADIANTIFGHFIAAISGGNLYRKSSFLLDSIGKPVFPEFLNISERPHIKGALASSAFDSEGVRTLDREIITAGCLETYLLTSYSARKLGLQTTGHAGGIHNWILNAEGEGRGGSFDNMLKKLGTGFLVTELMGQGVNVVNGDYSRGAAGFWVENGEIAFPVSEVTIAGNLQDMFNGLVAVGDDVDMRGSIRTGSLLIQEMQVAGN